MLDAFEIVTTSGIVVWRRHDNIRASNTISNVINGFINDVFIEERQKPAADESAPNASYKKDKYKLNYTTAKDLGLIFVVGKRGILLPSRL